MTSHHTLPDFPIVAHDALLALLFTPEPAISFRLAQPRRYAILLAAQAMPEPANMAEREAVHVAIVEALAHADPRGVLLRRDDGEGVFGDLTTGDLREALIALADCRHDDSVAWRAVALAGRPAWPARDFHAALARIIGREAQNGSG